MSSEAVTLADAIQLNRQDLLDEILAKMGITEINEQVFQELLITLSQFDAKRDKFLKALEAQKVVDHFLTDRLV